MSLRLRSFFESRQAVSLLIVGWVLIAWLSADHYYSRFAADLYAQESQLAQQQADNVAGNIDASLRLLKGIPLVFARDEDTRRELRRFGAQASASVVPYEERKQRWTQDRGLDTLNNSLSIAATNLDADVIWIVNAAGDCIAASNSGEADSFVGINYADRRYFRQARAGQRGSQYAVGRASRIPGMFYSAAVFEQERFLGAVVVKRNIDHFGRWTSQADAFVADANGVIVLAPEKELELRALPNAAVAGMPAQDRLLQYKRSAIEPLAITPWGDERFPAAVRMGAGSLPIVLAAKALPEDALAIHVRRPLSELVHLGQERLWIFIVLAGAGSLLIVAASAAWRYLRDARQAEAELRVAATAFEAQEGMMITDAKGVILRVNRAFTETTGYSAEEAVGQTPRLLRSGRHDAAFYAAMWDSVQRTGSWHGEIWDRRKDGEVYPDWLTITAVKGDDGKVTHYVATQTDISLRKAAEKKIERLAFYDPLTGLPNRRLLLDRLQQALANRMRSRRQGALLFIDLDNFKTLNDTFGHDKGDLLLQQVAQRLADCVRQTDTVARLGGDEFIVMLENLGEDGSEAGNQAEAIGQKILAALNRSYRLAGHEHHSTPSIGVTLFSDERHSIEELLKRADLAMYQAKAAGRNTLRFFDPEMQAVVTARVALEADLRAAVDERQFLLYYQAQTDAAGRIVGAEALVRWQHPERGMISPGDFIPLAEETGLILPLGRWVLETACRQLVSWATQPAAAHLSLAVNVSARQFRQADFANEVLEILADAGAAPQQLKLELTESLLLDDVEDTIAKMAALKAWGVSFSLDDFGTGYSSLSYIKRLPLDQLKIDQSFVHDLEWDDNDAAICAATIGLAHNLGIKVVAEGVETDAQRYFLTTVHRCDFMQGYLFSKPLPLPGFEALLSAGECTAAALGAGRQGLLHPAAARLPSTPTQPVPVG